ncbi:MAG: RHS repeat-associated core domain-containing protein [Phycisphaerae bacterium]
MRAVGNVCGARGAGGWSSTPSLHRRFVYSGWLLLLELDWRDLNDGNGGPPDGQPDKTVLKRYIWGLDLSQSLHAAGGTLDPIRLRQGQVGGLLGCIDTAGTSSTGDDRSFIYAYDAFGNITSQTGSYADANPFRFSTKYFDAETGLSYYGYRYYSARLGRWLSRDPIGEVGGINLYGFVGNAS